MLSRLTPAGRRTLAFGLAIVAVAGCSSDDDDDLDTDADTEVTAPATGPGPTGPTGSTEPTGSTTPDGTTSGTPPFMITLPEMLEVAGAPFVAATTWSAAFVRAAGADQVAVLVPPGSTDPFGVVPTAEELAPVADASFVVLDGREAAAGPLAGALPRDGEIITFTLDNDPDHVKAWVIGLSERFMLGTVAQEWVTAFDERLAEWTAQLDAARPTPAPTAVVDETLASWATLAGLDVVGTFAGTELTPESAGALPAADLVLVAAELPVPTGVTLPASNVVTLTNFPDESMDLLVLFQDNVDALVAAFEA